MGQPEEEEGGWARPGSGQTCAADRALVLVALAWEDLWQAGASSRPPGIRIQLLLCAGLLGALQELT